MTRFAFVDMHSGGRSKTSAEVWYVDAESEEAARERFTRHTGRDPDHVTCSCCGRDFWCTEYHAEEWPFEKPGDAGSGVVP